MVASIVATTEVSSIALLSASASFDTASVSVVDSIDEEHSSIATSCVVVTDSVTDSVSSKVNRFDLYEQKQLTHHHHNLKEELNTYKNRLQKCIDIVFPEFNSLLRSKYGIVYMNILKTFASAEKLANSDIRTIRKCFEFEGRGNRISLSAEHYL